MWVIKTCFIPWDLSLCGTVELVPWISIQWRIIQTFFRLNPVLLLLLLLSHFSSVWLCVTPWTAAHQAPQSMRYSRQEYWSGLPFPSPQHCLHFGSVQFSRPVVSDSLWPRESQHARPPCPSPTPVVHPNSWPSSGWCHPTISSSVIPSPPALSLSQHQGFFKWVSSY